MFAVSEGLREQTINIINDLVDDIAPGYLPPNRSIFLAIKMLSMKKFTNF